MQIDYIDKIEQLQEARDIILSAEVVAWDCETSGLDPLKDKLRTMQFAINPEHAYVIDLLTLDEPDLYVFFQNILASNRVVVTQNGKFDLQFFTRFMDQGSLAIQNFYDTMIVSKLLSFDRYYELKNGKPHWFEKNRHGLGEIARRQLGVELDKELQKSDFSGPLSEAQIEYAARDAAILLEIRESQRKEVYENSLERVARLECNFVPCVADLELNGIYLDQEEWTARNINQQVKADQLKKEFLELVAPHIEVIDLFGEPVINIGSPHQLLPLLQRAGLPVTSTKEDAIRPFISTHREAELLEAYREVETALKKFGPDYLNFASDVDGRVHADFQQITAPSGRMSCWKPNLQQLPQDPEYRTPFKAQTGGKIITADYGQIELRIMAMQSGDPQLTKVFMEGSSLHKHTCHTVLGEPLDNPDPHKYRISKNLNFGATYGAGGERFAQVAGITVDEAEKVLKKFWSVYFVLDAYQKAQGIKCAHGDARTFSGRRVRLNFDSEDRRAYSSAVRLGRNFGVQGTGADILKRACYLTRNRSIQQGFDCRLVNLVHDETVSETDDDPQVVSDLIEASMMEAGQEVLGEIPCTVEIKVGDTWEK